MKAKLSNKSNSFDTIIPLLTKFEMTFIDELKSNEIQFDVVWVEDEQTDLERLRRKGRENEKLF